MDDDGRTTAGVDRGATDVEVAPGWPLHEATSAEHTTAVASAAAALILTSTG
jgi:hypothetical protein